MVKRLASDGEWGTLANDDEAQERYEQWNLLDDLPAKGNNLLFDALCESKALTREDFLAIGTRVGNWNGKESLVYFFPDGLKYRTLETGQRATELGVRWVRGKVIPSLMIMKDKKGCIVAEGETDAAQLHRLAPEYDVMILPAGAKHITDTIVAQLGKYPIVYAALDNDDAGNEGARKLIERVPSAVRMVPPEGVKDWCEYAAVNGREPIEPEAFVQSEPRITFSLGDVLSADLGNYEDNHWYQQPILPINGLAVIHAAKKSGKSFWQLEWLRSLATGTTFAGEYEPAKPGVCARVLLFQFEVLPFDFQQRALVLFNDTTPEHREMLSKNFFTYHLGDGTIPRMRVSDTLIDTVRRAADECEAQVLAFDPVQRMTGSADQAKSNEMDPLLDMFAQLQAEGFTVIFSHHNNKAGGKGSRDANAMTGTQRFSGDPDTLCSIWHAPPMIEDDNLERMKQRNVTWELRNGAALGRSFTLRPDSNNEQLVNITYDQMITDSNLAIEAGAPEF
jgi:5S rRNA maturation endonuclease (ribonuclease M5)